ncbi:MAG TPA: HAD-IB family hydrolase, partial [Acidimicrobiales bacterium]|nr:HAD-IB family hydrolase [Acidimicrobiales bacterium]
RPGPSSRPATVSDEMARPAAFFDLDRTILRGASGPLITEALVTAGVLPDRSLPGQGLIYRVFDIIGETLPAMALARGAVVAARGWPQAAVHDAAKDAAERLDTLVAPYARPLMEEHRSAGRPVVLATTTPHDLVAPFAERLGFDDVVATRYASDGDGRYTGAITGNFVWARGKLSAVRRWAEDNAVDVGSSWAYSDSIYDLPLLSAVGHPHAVNPDPRLLAFAFLRRWPTLWLDAPPGVPKLVGVEPFDVLKVVLRPELFAYARFDFAGLDRVPRHGPAIVACNHRSYFDPVALGLAVARSGRSIRFLGKKELFEAPLVSTFVSAMGTIPVDRGHAAGGVALREAEGALEAGEVLGIMPQGTIPRGRDFFDPVLRGKSGAARLAAATGAPVIPAALWGTEQVWPRSSKVPHVWNVTHPPRVRVRLGDPVELEGADVHADTERIMAAITALLPAEARAAGEPSAAEVARATPRH